MTHSINKTKGNLEQVTATGHGSRAQGKSRQKASSADDSRENVKGASGKSLSSPPTGAGNTNQECVSECKSITAHAASAAHKNLGGGTTLKNPQAGGPRADHREGRTTSSALKPERGMDLTAAASLPGVSREVRPPITVDNALGAGRTADQKAHAAQLVNEALVRLRQYQEPVFLDRESGILILHWSRQIGKSFTLASWAVDRILTQLQTHQSWLITVLSNSRDNGAEFVIKCGEVCNLMGLAMEKQAQAIGDAAVYVAEDHSPDIKYENMRMEIRITIGNRIGRIKVLAANPRTARGFSGDLILDEFAFHEDSNAIWEAAEPILSANPQFLCRIASTGNGKHNMFYRMCSGPGPSNGDVFISRGGFKVSRVTRSEAWKMGVKIYDRNTRKPITPDEARNQSLDKRAYDQNYECQFTDENMALLTHDLISAAEREGITIDSQEWTPASKARMFRAIGDLEVGQDVGRNRDLSVVCVVERLGHKRRIIAMLRMSGMRLPAQQKQVDVVCAMPKFRRMEIDMTGIGLGLFEYLEDKWGSKISGVNFSSTEPVTERLKLDGRKSETAKVTEIMATDLLAVFEDRSIEIPADTELRDDLRKPEKIISPGGKVSIAATRDDAGHADHFWSIALAVRAGMRSGGPFSYQAVQTENRTEPRIGRFKGVIMMTGLGYLFDALRGLRMPSPNFAYTGFRAFKGYRNTFYAFQTICTGVLSDCIGVLFGGETSSEEVTA